MTSRSTALFAFLGLAAVPALQNPWPQPEDLSERWSDQHRREIRAQLRQALRDWGLQIPAEADQQG